MKPNLAAGELSPWKLYVTLLTIVFVSEFSVMLVLPKTSLASAPHWLAGAVDAGVLTLFMVPLFGWLIIRPLQHVVHVRSNLLQHFILLQEEERGRIARDLHDEIGQSFMAVLMGLRALDITEPQEAVRGRLNELADVVTKTLEEVRRLTRGLRPAILDHLGLVRAIEQYADDFKTAHKIAVELEAEGIDSEHRVPANVETAVYRIIQEALTNAARHGDARRVRISLAVRQRQLRVEIADNGRGFSRRQIDQMSSSGLLGMAERVALLDGDLQIDTRPGDGVRIKLTIPVAEGGAR